MADAHKEEAKTEAAPAAAKKDAGAKKKGSPVGFFIFMILFGASVPFILPTLTLFLVGMIPTVVALLVDSDRQKSSTAATGAMNAAGIVPFIIDLWMRGQTMGNVFQILKEPSSWLVMLGAAGIGQLIVFAVPQAVASLSLSRSETRLKILRQNLESLKETWGPEVGTSKPIEKVGRME